MLCYCRDGKSDGAVDSSYLFCTLFLASDYGSQTLGSQIMGTVNDFSFLVKYLSLYDSKGVDSSCKTQLLTTLDFVVHDVSVT